MRRFRWILPFFPILLWGYSASRVEAQHGFAAAMTLCWCLPFVVILTAMIYGAVE